MKVNYSILILLIYTFNSFAQVGVNTTNPKTALHTVNKSGEELGLTVPTVTKVELSTSTDGTAIPNGTLVYDDSRDALCVKLKGGWNCIARITNEFVLSPTLPNYVNANQPVYIKASNSDDYDNFSNSMSLSADGNTLAVGAFQEDTNARGINSGFNNNDADNSGAVYIFVRDGNSWIQQAFIKASNADINDEFGTSVSLSSDGNTLAVGAINESSNGKGVNADKNNNSNSGSGAAYIFTRNNSEWTEQSYIKASNTGRWDGFGERVFLSPDGSTLAVSSTDENSSATGINGNENLNTLGGAGAVYVFCRNGNLWSQQAYIKPSTMRDNDHFGISIGLSEDGNILAVGSYGEKSNATGVNGDESNDSAYWSGAVYIYERNGNEWSQQAYIKASNTNEFDYFGENLYLSSDGKTLAVGAIGEASGAQGINNDQLDNSKLSSGAVYVFTHYSGQWRQQAYIKASKALGINLFGSSITLSSNGDMLAVGARSENGGSTGINGDQNDRSGSGSGAVYLFERNEGIWSQQAYIKASNTGQSDMFGYNVSMSSDGENLAIGAIWEESNATGINGDQTNNNLSRAGAVYIYEAP